MFVEKLQRQDSDAGTACFQLGVLSVTDGQTDRNMTVYSALACNAASSKGGQFVKLMPLSFHH